ncbi:MAG: hypothetical protein JWR67_3650 [Mucilaginibacter sp.]|nr:hypothetical protein [Mucilaginibacter sp.]
MTKNTQLNINVYDNRLILACGRCYHRTTSTISYMFHIMSKQLVFSIHFPLWRENRGGTKAEGFSWDKRNRGCLLC